MRGTWESIRLSAWIYRRLLSLYPAPFRRSYGAAMETVFRDQYRHLAPRGPLALVALWSSEVVDLLKTAGAEWFDQLSRQFSAPPVAQMEEERNEMIDSIRQDFRYSLRGIFRQPLFSLIVIFTLALGVGANTAIFSVLNGTLLTPLPYPGSERIITIWEDFTAQGGPEREWIEVPNFFEWKKQSQSFETMSAYTFGPVNLLLKDEPVRLNGGLVSRDYFQGFGTEPVLGRTFTAEEDRPGGRPVTILSFGFWQEHFAGDAGVLGETLIVNDQPTTIVGVLPESFRSPVANQIDVWQPVQISPTSHGRSNFFLRGVGRLKEGVPLARAQAEMNAIMERIGQEFPENEGVKMQLIPLLDIIVQPVKTSLWTLQAAVLLVLLIACANIANLMLSRSAVRRREMAVRAAIGAGRSRLVRQLLTESVLLAFVGGALGLVLGKLGSDLLVAMAPSGVPRLDEVSLDLTVLGFTLAVSLASAIVFGLVPALQGSRTNLNAALNSAARNVPGSAGGHRLRSALVVIEIALVLTLLVSSGLFLRSFSRLQSVDPGFQPDHLFASSLIMSSSRFPRGDQLRTFTQEVLQNIESSPGVEAVSGVSVLPLSGNDSDTGFYIEGRPAPTRPQDEPVVWFRRTFPEYFSIMGIPLLQGRDFTESDHADAPGVVIISEVTAERFWPGENALGKRVRFGGEDSPWSTIVGIVPGVRHQALNEPPRPELYFPFSQRPGRFMNLLVKSSQPTSAVAGAIREGIRAADASLPVDNVTRVSELMETALGQDRLLLRLTGGFAALAVILASVGIYGVISYSVSQRTYEMGLRMALGAQRGSVLKIILSQGLLLTGLGIVAGVGLSLWVTRYIGSILFDTSPTDPLTFAGTTLLLTIVGLAACLLPAYRATRIDPLQALRCD